MKSVDYGAKPLTCKFSKALCGGKRQVYSQALVLDCGGPSRSAENYTLEEFSKLCTEGCLQTALQILHLMLQHRAPAVSANIFYCILLECMKKEDLKAGREAHCLIVQGGLDSDTFLGSHLIRMFASCGSLFEANQVFRRLPHPSVFTWSAIILAHANLGQGCVHWKHTC